MDTDQLSPSLTQPSIETPVYTGPCRRQNAVSGRRQPLSFFSLRQLSRRGERRHPGRRVEDWQNPYVDWYEPALMWLVAGTVILACLDAFLTLQLWHHNAVQLSPLMAAVIEQSASSYVTFKVAITGLALTLMVIYKTFSFYRVFRVSHLLYALFGIYTVLVANALYVLIKL